jgi:hypothetical protein
MAYDADGNFYNPYQPGTYEYDYEESQRSQPAVELTPEQNAQEIAAYELAQKNQLPIDYSVAQRYLEQSGGSDKWLETILPAALAVVPLLIPGVGQILGASILSSVGITGASAAVTAGVGAAALSAATTAASGGSAEDVLKNAASAGFASGVNISLGGGVTGAAAGSVAGTAIKGGDVDQVLTNALAAGVGAGVTGVIGPAAGTIATSLVATGGVSDQTLFNAAVAEINGFNKPGNASAQIVEATGVPTTSSEINTQMQRLNFQQDLRDQLMNDGAFQQVSMLPVIAAGAEIAAEVAIPAIIRAAPVIAEYMGANMAREQIAAAIADVAGHAAAAWYISQLSPNGYFQQRFDLNLPPLSDAELDQLEKKYTTTVAYVPSTDPNTLDKVIITATLTPEQRAALSNPTTAEAAAANVSSTVTTVSPNGQTTTAPATTTSGVISVNNVAPLKSDAAGGAAGGGGASGGGAAGGGGGGGTPAAGTPGAGAAGGETAGAGGTAAPGAGAGGDGGAAGGGAGIVTGAGGGPGAGPGAGVLIGDGGGATGNVAGSGVTDLFAGGTRPTKPDTSGGGGTLPNLGQFMTPMGVPDLGGPPTGGGASTVVGGGGTDGVDPFAGYVRPTAPDTSGGGGTLPDLGQSMTPMAVPILPGPPSANVTANVTPEEEYVRPTAPPYTLPVLPDWKSPTPMDVPILTPPTVANVTANVTSNVVVTGGGGNNVSNVVVTSGGANNVSNVATKYPTVTTVPPTPRVRLPVISGASPSRLLADALAAYRPAGAIEGEESGKERQNVWNEKSLRLKDALGL